MTLQDAIIEIENRGTELLEKAKNGKGYICPICNIGSIDDQNGISTPDNKTFSCPGGCYSHIGVLDIIAMKGGIKEQSVLVRMAADELGLKLDGDEDNNSEEEVVIQPKDTSANATKMMDSLQGQIPVDSAYPEYTIFYDECAEYIEGNDYMQSIGISKELQDRFHMGYCENWIHPNTSADVRQFISATPRIIIPTSRFSYVARYCGTSKNVAKMQRAGIPSLFNHQELYTSQEPLFIFEDEIDAISMMECGYDSMAIGAINNIELLGDALENKRSERFLILSIKDTEDTRMHIGKLREKLKELGQDSILFNLAQEYDCLNDMYIQDKDRLVGLIEEALAKVAEYEQEKIKDYQSENSNSRYMDWYKQGITLEAATPCIPTNLAKLDEILDGGLYEGIYTMGAGASLGKTTLALQIADGIASNDKTDIIYFSLETAKSELIAKSLSRLTAEIVIKKKQVLSNAKTTREITVKEKYDKYLERDKKVIRDACDKYMEIAKNIYMHECEANFGVKKIKEVIEKHLENTKRVRRKTVAIIDYLQILASYDEQYRTDKQNIELNMSYLKRISAEYKIPILILNSYGFDMYNETSSMDEFNDIKSIENASDVLINISFNNLRSVDFNIDEAMKISPREVSITVLKNRNGKALNSVDMFYYPEYNIFTDEECSETVAKSTTSKTTKTKAAVKTTTVVKTTKTRKKTLV